MPLPVYPAELPPPLAADLAVQFGDGRYRSQNDAGPPNVRRRFSSVANSVQFSTLLDRQQLGRFESFYGEMTKGGTRAFLIPDPTTDGWPWLDEDGNALLYGDDTPILVAASWLAMFDQLPSIRLRDIHWTVSFSLLVMP